MNKYAFVLGRKPKLSIAELDAVFGEKNEIVHGDIYIKELEEVLENPQKFLDRLGGTIKIAEVFDEVTHFEDVEGQLIEYLSKKDDKKIIFALNFHNISHKDKNSLNNLLKNVKKGLREKGLSCRFLNKPNENIKSVVTLEEKLHEKGTDILIIQDGENYLLARTIVVQNYKNYSVRDYDRPARDPKSGMSPPKLSQIMINLACMGSEKCTIYDPFCGSGTVLMEGMLMGYDVSGSDIREKAVEDSKRNCVWLKEKFSAIGTLLDCFLQDATKINKDDLSVLPDCIVGETYLGPPLFKIPSDEIIKNNFREIELIILEAIRKFCEILSKGGKFVLAIPYYKAGKKKFFIDGLRDKISKLGFSEFHAPLLYDRKDQTVGRQILCFKKK